MMMKRKRLILSSIIIILIGGISWYFYAKAKAGAAGWGAMPPSPVSVVNAKWQNWQQQVQATGTLNAVEGVMLKSEVSGRVTKILFVSGQDVKAGELLLEINPSILQAQLIAAQANAELARNDYERSLALYQRGALSKQDLETALTKKNADAANVQTIQAQLNQNLIRAPFSGRLGLRLFSLGDYINAGQNLVNLQALNPLQVDFTVPENDAAKIHVGDKVQLQSDAFPDTTFIGKIQAIDSAVDNNSRTVALRAQIPNQQQKLLPGSFVQVTVFAGLPRRLVTVPQIAVVYDANGDYVFTVRNGHAVKTSIKVIEKNTDQAAISGGLQANTPVVIEGQLKIMDGAPVMVMPANSSSGS